MQMQPSSLKLADMKSFGRGCETCKDRRIRYDRLLPACLNCARSNRRCQGYHLKLSWSRLDDPKRFQGTKHKSLEEKPIQRTLRLINTYNSDIEIYHRITTGEFHSRLAIPRPLTWSPIKSDGDYKLLQYFVVHVSNLLTTIHPSNQYPILMDVVMRFALTQCTASSTAVLQSILALSSLYRNGFQAHAAKLKLSALSALADSAKMGVRHHEVESHVSALMLLCSFEIQASDTTNHFLFYISSIKNVFKSIERASALPSRDMTTLLYWVSHHEILSRFSLRYWNRRGIAKDAISTNAGDMDILVKETKILEALDVNLTCPRMLATISEVLDIVTHASHDTSSETLKVLEWKLRKYLVCTDTKAMLAAVVKTPLCQEFFLLALLIYIQRASSKITRQSNVMRSRLDTAFKILPQLDTIERQFPLLIIGCEARSDEHIIIVLDAISRTEKKNGLRSLGNLGTLIQSLWAQDDLAERELKQC